MMAPPAPKQAAADRNLVLLLGAVVLVVLLAFSVWGPQRQSDDPHPTTFNAGSQGVKAAYLLGQDLGYSSQRWNQPLAGFKQVNPSNTTLILTEPILPLKNLAATKGEVADFLSRGGRVLATGTSGAALLPGGATAAATSFVAQACLTRPEGDGELARAGRVRMAAPVRWDGHASLFHVEQRCGADAVVVSYSYGKGEAIWWASPMPLSNAGLRDDASLALMLASLGPVTSAGATRTLLFDEYLHTARETLGETLAGLPWWALKLQIALVAAALIFSFSRRNGPLRLPLVVPRSSPLEFAYSMGSLYERAQAVEAPLAAARTLTLRLLAEQCGLSQELLRQPPAMIGEALGARIGGDWTALGQHLEAAAHAAERKQTSRQALKLVQALGQDRRLLAAHLHAPAGLRAPSHAAATSGSSAGGLNAGRKFHAVK